VSCSRPGCENEPTWQPVIEAGPKTQPVRARLVHVGFCDVHKEQTKLDDVLAPEGFTKLAKHVRERGWRAPASKTARLAWIPVSPEAKAVLDTKTDPVGKSEELAF
jgi:hypothetical protein